MPTKREVPPDFDWLIGSGEESNVSCRTCGQSFAASGSTCFDWSWKHFYLKHYRHPVALESLAEVVHNAYLKKCAELNWPVRPENQVSYDDLTEPAKELDRAVALAVMNHLPLTPELG